VYYNARHGDGQAQTRSTASDVGHDNGPTDCCEPPLRRLFGLSEFFDSASDSRRAIGRFMPVRVFLWPWRWDWSADVSALPRSHFDPPLPIGRDARTRRAHPETLGGSFRPSPSDLEASFPRQTPPRAFLQPLVPAQETTRPLSDWGIVFQIRKRVLAKGAIGGKSRSLLSDAIVDRVVQGHQFAEDGVRFVKGLVLGLMIVAEKKL